MTDNSLDKPLEPQQLDQWFLDLLACPACDQHLPLHLNSDQTQLRCECGRYGYPVREGIPILLVEEAELLDASAEPPGGLGQSG